MGLQVQGGETVPQFPVDPDWVQELWGFPVKPARQVPFPVVPDWVWGHVAFPNVEALHNTTKYVIIL